MALNFSRIRITGFKSFVEPTEIYIEPGLTGIVGPNGCGKSNLVEAMRWVMGETSAKSMRGGAMDDVIFAGTASRPARNMAEVTLLLDNKDRQAPAAFNNFDQLEISRRIERDSGSAYRVNGNEVRARDVQLLFADVSTGPHSPSMVSQGRVGALIMAKPKERRAILEEAAGVSGLHSRRHEAELRLRAAETNLERLDDVIQQIDLQLQGLKRQSRQASRYRNLSGHIRKAEATLLYLRWLAAVQANEVAQAGFKDADQTTRQLTGQTAAAATAQTAAAEQLPRLRETEAEEAARLHRLNAERNNLDGAEARCREDAAQARTQIEQIERDQQREVEMEHTGEEAVKRLDAEKQVLEAERNQQNDSLADVATAAEDAAALLLAAEQQLDILNRDIAAENAQRLSLNGAVKAAQLRLDSLAGQRQKVADDLAKATPAPPVDQMGDDAAEGSNISRLADLALEASDALEAAEQAQRANREVEGVKRQQLQAAESEVAKVRAEERALNLLLAAQESDLWPPVMDQITVSSGYESALGVALGDDLAAPADDSAPVFWSGAASTGPSDSQPPALPPAPALPEGTVPLQSFVDAPAILHQRLSQIGVVDDAHGDRLASSLLQGQRLVSKEGALWRWDGLRMKAGAPTAAAVRLAQRNRLAELADELAKAETVKSDRQQKFTTAKTTLARTVEQVSTCRNAWRQAEQAVATAREAESKASREAAEKLSRQAALAERLAALDEDIGQTEVSLADAQQSLAAIGSDETLSEQRTELQNEVGALRTGLQDARLHRDNLKRDNDRRAQRLSALSGERTDWLKNVAGASEQRKQLSQRADGIRRTLAELDRKPEAIARQRTALIEQTDKVEKTRQIAADELAKAETALAQCDQDLRTLQDALGNAREDRARFEATCEQSAGRLRDSANHIAETLDCSPDEARVIAELPDPRDHAADSGDMADGAEIVLPPLDKTEERLERLKRERENMGAVNLRAEEESQELTVQRDTLLEERADLENAISRLRQGIGKLNREGRQRLLEAFKSVNQHFAELFTDLFGGGNAHLELVESDDPLEAGLEIMASPPGKKLQSLSLLSGGEQALTALSLLFAVFKTNPSPICVLDEVDAPLDDANVGRLCNMIESIAAETATRFLMITHHAVTMSRVDRLYGVTMSERGISQLVSVDLNQATQIRATA